MIFSESGFKSEAAKVWHDHGTWLFSTLTHKHLQYEFPRGYLIPWRTVVLGKIVYKVLFVRQSLAFIE